MPAARSRRRRSARCSRRPRHPYTRGAARLGAAPRRFARGRRRRRGWPRFPGVVPSLKEAIAGCPFAPRCALRDRRAAGETYPPLEEKAAAAIAPPAGESDRLLARMTVHERDRRVAARSSDLKKHFPVQPGPVAARRSGQVHAVDGISFSHRRGRDAGPRRRESGCGKSTAGKTILQADRADRRARSTSTASASTSCRALSMRPYRRELQVVFQDPYSSLNPRMRAEDIVAEPLQQFRRRGAARSHERGRRAVRARSACGRDQMIRYPARVLRRPAPAPRHRARAGAAAAAHRLRRAGLGARRLGAGAGDQPAGRSAARVRRSPTCSSPTTLPSSSTSATASPSCISAASSSSPTKRALFASPQHPYTEALLSAVPVPDPDARSPSASSSRATCRARSSRRRAATSTPAARTPSRAAGSRHR